MNITLPHEWAPRIYQQKLWAYMQGPEEGKRAVCIWHRRAGKDLTALNLCNFKAFQRVGSYWHVLPTYQQGRKIVWQGATRDGKRFLDYIPRELIRSKHSTEMRIELKNGSIYQVVGTDNIDALVGTNPVGCVFSEYSLQNPAAWDYIRPILAENGGWAVFIYTPRGKNHGYRLMQMAKKNPKWFCEILKAGNHGTKREDGSPVISDELIQEERNAGMAEELIRQEFFVDFDAPIVGAYYSQQMSKALADGRITRIPHEPKLPVDTAWDIGVGDATTIWFIQTFRNEHRVIDYYEKSGEGLPHFIKVLKGQEEGYGRMADYTYGTHYAPHDIEVREWASGAKSRIDTARELGVRFRTVTQHAVADGIEAVRNVLPMCWFDEENCAQGIEALRGYTKEYDEKRRIFRNNPLHNWASHGCLTGDSMVELVGGPKRIDEVAVGDQVMLGPVTGNVSASEFTGIQDVLEITFSNGMQLRATPSHKVFTTGGLTRCDSLCIGDELLEEDFLWRQQSLHNSTQLREDISLLLKETGFGSGQSVASTPARKAANSGWLTRFFTRCEAVRSRVAWRLSRLANGLISVPKTGGFVRAILGGFRHLSTGFKSLGECAFTGVQMATTPSDWSTGMNTCTGMCGDTTMERSRLGTMSTILTETSPITTYQTWSFNPPHAIQSSMPKTTSGLGLRRTRSSSGRHRNWPSNGTVRQKAGSGTVNTPLKVVSVKRTGEQPTYDLTIDGHHCYIANGVLVSNSDAFRIFAMSYKRKYFGDAKMPRKAVDNFKYV